MISQPFWPAYMTAERIAKAPNLKMSITAGIGSDHVDLQAAIEQRDHRRRGHLLQLDQRLRARGDDDPGAGPQLHPVVPDRSSTAAGTSPTRVSREYDVEGMQVGTVAAGRIGTAVLRRLKPFDVGLHYTDRHRLPRKSRRSSASTFHETTEDDGPGVRRRHDQLPRSIPRRSTCSTTQMISKMKRGAYIVNTARGKICDRDAIVRALESGSSPATRATSGSRSRRRGITPGARCPTTG